MHELFKRLIAVGFQADRAERICTCYEKTDDEEGLERFVKAMEGPSLEPYPAFASLR